MLRNRVEIRQYISVIIGSTDDKKRYVDSDVEMSDDDATVFLIYYLKKIK